MTPPTRGHLISLFTYDKEENRLRWLPRSGAGYLTRRWNTRYAGTLAGTLTQGYIKIHINTHVYFMHRLIWIYFKNEPLPQAIDHIDCNPLNNSPSNLRVATAAQNGSNRGPSHSNSSGVKGVSWYAKIRKWRVVIHDGGKQIYLGATDTIEEGAALYAAAAEKHQGQFLWRGARS